jgi:hypothetical protein
MDLGHPSRLPFGSLRSAWTGPGRDPKGLYSYELCMTVRVTTKDENVGEPE